jgi:hypothetical protein
MSGDPREQAVTQLSLAPEEKYICPAFDALINDDENQNKHTKSFKTFHVIRILKLLGKIKIK